MKAQDAGARSVVGPGAASAWYFGPKSLGELVGVYPDLVEAVHRALRISPIDFAVHDGLRTAEEQREYLARGVSLTLNSKHLRQADGWGHAVDLVPYVNGKLRWEMPLCVHIAHAMLVAADEVGIELIWGGCWDRRLSDFTSHTELERAPEEYAKRRRARFPGKRILIDGPHFEVVV